MAVTWLAKWSIAVPNQTAFVAHSCNSMGSRFRNDQHVGKQRQHLVVAPVVLLQIWQGVGLCDVQKDVKHLNDFLPVPGCMIACTDPMPGSMGEEERNTITYT